MANSTRDRVDLALEWAGFGMGAVGVLAGIGLFGGQAVWWLRFGSWPGLSVGDGLAFMGLALPATGWLGLGKILDWLAALPLGVGLACIGLLAGWTLIRLAEPAKPLGR